MPAPALLLERLDAIARSIEQSGHGVALLALGSVGIEQARLDEYSDLDFFAIVADGSKPQFLASLDWLERVHPIVYSVRNTIDGYKVLYADGVFAEFAVFETHELKHIPYSEGRWVWHVPNFDTGLRVSNVKPQPRHAEPIEQVLGEALTNLYVGLMRFHRGEKLTALRFIQQFAVDRVMELAPHVLEAQASFPDAYSPERRVERRYLALAPHLPTFMQGYEHSPASAAAILAFLDAHFAVNAGIKAEILRLVAHIPPRP